MKLEKEFPLCDTVSNKLFVTSLKLFNAGLYFSKAAFNSSKSCLNLAKTSSFLKFFFLNSSTSNPSTTIVKG